MSRFFIRKHTHALIAIGFLLLMAFSVMIFTGCDFDDKSYKQQDGYVEVDSLKIESANISMATSGECATYQVQAQIVPANATNRKLSYYIPSEYYSYVTVDGNGLLTAHQVTEGFTVPLTVTSTSNKNAKLTVNITIEDVAVKRISFTQESLSLLYNGESQEINVEFEPYHAVEGRTLTYKSLNEKVATVETVDGKVMVKPVGVGQTRIQAVSKPTGSLEQIEAYLPVVVDYAKAQYALVVNGTPRWTQVVGDFSAIDFTLLVMGDNVDPNPEIEWYIGSERDITASDLRQYTHIPSQSTQITYQVCVHVKAYKQDMVYLYSNDIVIYNAFSGYSLDYENFSHAYTPYQYGDTVRFALQESSSSSTDHYDWTLKREDGDGTEMKIATTTVAERDLVREINVVGDYYLSVEAKDVNNNTLSTATSFTFSSERLIVGDTLVVSPVLADGGLPPDSYHWYIVPCEADGTYDLTKKVKITDTASTETLYYPLQKAGNYRLVVTSSTDGVPSTVKNAAGEWETYTYIGDVLRVYTPEDTLSCTSASLVGDEEKSYAFLPCDTQVQDVVIEGIRVGEKSFLYLHWAPTEGVDRYLLEFIFEDGTVKIMDSVEYPSSFGANFVTVPTSVATLQDKFTVRVKQKDGLYSDSYSYGIANIEGTSDKTHTLTIPSDAYPYFANLSTNNNLYVTSADEIYTLLQYILLFTPTQNGNVIKGNEQIDGVLYDTFTVTYYSAIKTQEEMLFDIDLPESLQSESKEYRYMYNLLLGAQRQGAFRTNCLFDLKQKNSIYTLTVKLPNNRQTKLETTQNINFQIVKSAFYASEPYVSAENLSFFISGKDQVLVTTSDQLVYAIESGLNPIPNNDSLADLYKTVKGVYASIIDATMDNREKTLAFFDWLCLNVRADTEEESKRELLNEYECYLYDSYHLEGVFNSTEVTSIRGKANSCGISKAFSVLCGLAGIPCKTVLATVESQTYAHNLVYLDGNWYVVDATSGRKTNTKGTVYADHAYFLLSDEEYASLWEEYALLGNYPTAEKSDDTVLPLVNSDKKLGQVISSVTQEGRIVLEIVCDSEYVASETVFSARIAGLTSGGKTITEWCKGSADNHYILVLEDRTY